VSHDRLTFEFPIYSNKENFLGRKIGLLWVTGDMHEQLAIYLVDTQVL